MSVERDWTVWGLHFQTLSTLVMSRYSKRSREDCLIDLKKDLDALGLDRNDPSTFICCSNAAREQATDLILSYLEVFSDDAIVSMYKEHLQLARNDNRSRPAGPRTQSSILNFFGKRRKVPESAVSSPKPSVRSAERTSPILIIKVPEAPDNQIQQIPLPDPNGTFKSYVDKRSTELQICEGNLTACKP
jgi:hypothetical protein